MAELAEPRVTICADGIQFAGITLFLKASSCSAGLKRDKQRAAKTTTSGVSMSAAFRKYTQRLILTALLKKNKGITYATLIFKCIPSRWAPARSFYRLYADPRNLLARLP